MIPRGENVARYFFEGLPEGAAIPWGAWVLPLTYWYGFFLHSDAAMICTMVILRKQWVEREKLAYPLVQVPMEMIQREQGRAIGRAFFANKPMWLGFAFAFVLLSVNGLHAYFPEVPRIARTTSLPLFRDTVRLDLWFSRRGSASFTLSTWIFPRLYGCSTS